MRLAIIDELVSSDLAPVELRRLLKIESNLLAHHLDVLESVGLVSRSRSSGDGRRRYVHLERRSLAGLSPGHRLPSQPALFVCTQNSARSQLAAAIWRALLGAPAESAGTRPAARVHPAAIAAARRAGFDLAGAVPRQLDDIEALPPLVVTVCDQAHESIPRHAGWLHWSIPDPVAADTAAAFDATVVELRQRIADLVDRSTAAS